MQIEPTCPIFGIDEFIFGKITLVVVFVTDRFTRGVAAGLLAGIPTVAADQTSYYSEFSSLRYQDFVSLMIYGGLPDTRGEVWFALFVAWLFMGALGAVFALLIPTIKSGTMPLKGLIFGISVWFVSYAATALFKIPELQNITLQNTFSNFVSASIWGLVLGLSLNRLNNRTGRADLP